MTNDNFIREQIKTIQKELEDRPDEDALLNDLGVGYYLIGDYDNAIPPLKAAVKIQPVNATYLFNLANVYSEKEEFTLAKKFYLDALEQNPEHIPSLTNLADCYEAAGELVKAGELFEYITKLAPENALGFFNLGNFYLRRNEHIKAVKQYEKAISLENSFVDAYYNIAWVLSEAKAYKEAHSYAQKGIDLDPNHSELLDLLNKIRPHISE